VSTKKDGSERLNFNGLLTRPLLEAKGLSFGDGTSKGAAVVGAV